MRRKSIVGCICLSVVMMSLFMMSTVIQAQTGNIDPVDKWAWGTNVGWLNFRPVNGGVTVYADHLEGYAWAENIGWIRLGTREGGGAHTYANTSDTDYGVNRDVSGNLSGYAWGTNVGWINFAPDYGGVTIDPVTGSFDGYAWGENVGWIHFKNDTPAYNVVTAFEGEEIFNILAAVDGETGTALDFAFFDFGWHCVGDQACGELVITNAVDIDVTIMQVCTQCTVVAGSGCRFFVVESPAPRDEVLKPGESLTVGFCYHPNEEPPAQGFRWDRCFNAAVSYKLAGYSSIRTLDVYLEGKRAEDECFLGRMADEQDFGTVRIGFSQEQIIQIWNTGCRPLTVETIASSVPEFTVLNPTFPLTVAEHGARDIVVRFDPPGVGEVVGVLTVVSNAQNRNVETGELIGDVEIAVKGIGIEAVIGDVTEDGELNLLDLVQLVNIVLGTLEPTAQQVWAADMDGNGVINILDAIALVNVIMTE